MKKRLVSVVLVAAFAFSMLAGCGSDNSAANDNKNNTSAEAEKTASNDGDFNLTVNFASEPMTMDPALNSSVDGAVMANHLFEGLMKWESTGEEVEGSDGTCDSAKLTYGQAESYDKTANDDGTVTYTFHLRDGIKWSDGKDVTAKDFEYAWKRLVNPATAADYNYMLDCVVNANEIMAGEKDPSELAVKAVDDKTFEVTLTTDLPYFDELCAFPAMMPVRQDIIEANGDQWTFDPSTYISNGPYKLTEWTHNSQIVMAKDENYYDYENLGPDTLTFKLMDDTNAMLSGFKSGELDYIQEAPQAELPNLIASGDMKIVDYLGTYYVCFQTQKAPFDNPKVREAFTLAVDRNYIVDKVTQSGQVEASAYVPSGISDAEEGSDFRKVGGDYYDPTKDAYEANCEKARQLLAEAGYENGAGFPALTYIVNNDSRKEIAEAIVNDWKEVLGIDSITVEKVENFSAARRSGDYDLAYYGWFMDYKDLSNMYGTFVNTAEANSFYQSDAYDAAYTKAISADNEADQWEAYKECDSILSEDLPVSVILHSMSTYLFDDTDYEGLVYSCGNFVFTYLKAL